MKVLLVSFKNPTVAGSSFCRFWEGNGGRVGDALADSESHWRPLSFSDLFLPGIGVAPISPWIHCCFIVYCLILYYK